MIHTTDKKNRPILVFEERGADRDGKLTVTYYATYVEMDVTARVATLPEVLPHLAEALRMKQNNSRMLRTEITKASPRYKELYDSVRGVL